jgi:hypothetical protein
MFSIPRVNVIESDAGYSVEVLGRTGLEYREGPKTMFIDSEVLAKQGIAIFKRSIVAWKPPFDEDPVTESKKDEIIQNLVAAFEFCNDVVHVQ